jgi:hypothetical protein
MMIKTRFAAAAIMLTVAFGCNQKSDKENGAADTTATDTSAAGNLETDTKVQDFVQSLPSPIHIAKIFQRAGLKYIPGMTNSPGNAAKYLSPYSKSVNLGVYTTDLSYCTFNNQSQEAISFFKAVKTMTDGLNLTSIFEGICEGFFIKVKSFQTGGNTTHPSAGVISSGKEFSSGWGTNWADIKAIEPDTVFRKRINVGSFQHRIPIAR